MRGRGGKRVFGWEKGKHCELGWVVDAGIGLLGR